MTQLESKEIHGITLKNIVVTLFSTISIVASVMTTYFNLKSDISAIASQTVINNRVTDIRLKALETQVTILQKQVDDLKTNKK